MIDLVAEEEEEYIDEKNIKVDTEEEQEPLNIVEESITKITIAGYLLELRDQTSEEEQILRTENLNLKNKVILLENTIEEMKR